MSVYVDDARIPFRGMLMCHLFADSTKELHEFATRLRLHKWSYQRGETLAHYQVSMSQRRRALELGAVAVTPEWRRERIRAETEKILKRSASKPRAVLGLKVPLAVVLLAVLSCGDESYPPPDPWPVPVVRL